MRTVPSSIKYIPSAASPCLIMHSPSLYERGIKASAKFIRSYDCCEKKIKIIIRTYTNRYEKYVEIKDVSTYFLMRTKITKINKIKGT